MNKYKVQIWLNIFCVSIGSVGAYLSLRLTGLMFYIFSVANFSIIYGGLIRWFLADTKLQRKPISEPLELALNIASLSLTVFATILVILGSLIFKQK